MELAFHRRLREGFLDIAKRAPARCALVPAQETIETLEARILDLVRERLKLELS